MYKCIIVSPHCLPATCVLTPLLRIINISLSLSLSLRTSHNLSGTKPLGVTFNHNLVEMPTWRNFSTKYYRPGENNLSMWLVCPEEYPTFFIYLYLDLHFLGSNYHNVYLFIHLSHPPFTTFKASALWADAFYKSKCPSVCVSVCVFSFEVPLKCLFGPTSQSRIF